MSVFLQSVLAVFAAVGFYTVLHTVYEIVSARLLRLHGSAELTLYGDGCDAVSEHLIRAAPVSYTHLISSLHPHLRTFVRGVRDAPRSARSCLITPVQ